MNICFSPMNKNYFSIDEDNNYCDKCKKQKKMLFYIIFWRKNSFSTKLLCENCTKNIQDFGFVDEKKLIIFTHTLPEDAIPVFLNPPKLKESKNNLSVFDAAVRQVGEEITVDKTVLANRGSWVGAKIGNYDKKLLESKDREVNLKQGLKVIENAADTK
jgi:hypothetical protein